jgi:hypothetical protein
MKYLKRFNESSEEDWDLEEIKDIFQDFLDEGLFRLDDVVIGSSLTIAPKLWCNSHRDFTGESFSSLTIKLVSEIEGKYDFSLLDVLDECIKHFESIYGFELESIYTVGLPTGVPMGIGYKSLFNWFNSCQTIKDISKANNLKKLTIDRLDITFKLS